MKTTRLSVIILTASMFLVCLLSSFELVTKIKGDGNLTKEKYDIADFDEIKISCPGNIYYDQKNGTPALKVETDRNILDNLDMIVKDRVLIIKPKKHSINLSPTKFELHVCSPGLESVKLAADANVYIEDLTTTDVEIEVAGSGSVKISGKLAAVDLEAEISGSGNICFGTGTVSEAEFAVSGNGIIRAEELEAQKAEAKIAGNGEIRLNAVQKLSTSIAGSGNIYYKGNPQIKSNTAGSGRVIPVTK